MLMPDCNSVFKEQTLAVKLTSDISIDWFEGEEL